MFSQPMLFLAVLLVIGLVAKNQSLIIAVAFLLILKLIGLDSKVFLFYNQKELILG